MMLPDVTVKSIVFTWLMAGVFVFWDGTSCAGDSKYRAECKVFDNITRRLNQESKDTMRCVKNAQCTGFDCTGKYQYRGLYTVNFCFGMALHPCHKPVDMHFYVEQPNKSATNANISSNKLEPIKSVHYKVRNFGSITGFMAVNFTSVKIKGQTKVRVAMTFKVRLHTPIGDTWPSSFQRVLVEETWIPVPKCDRSVSTPTGTAHCYTYKGSTKRPTVAPTPSSRGQGHKKITTVLSTIYSRHPSPTRPPTPKVTDATSHTSLEKPCHPGKLYTCAPKEVCRQGSDKKWYCECLNPDPDAGCRVPDTTTARLHPVTKANTVLSTKAPPGNKSHHACKVERGDFVMAGCTLDFNGNVSTAPDTIIIATCSVGAVIVVGALLAGMLYKYKKHRERYGQHEVLLNNDDDQDDVVI